MRYSRLPPNPTGGPESDYGPRRPNGSASIWNPWFHHAPQATVKRGACGQRQGQPAGEGNPHEGRGTPMRLAETRGFRGQPMNATDTS